jgi:hypothetical protein
MAGRPHRPIRNLSIHQSPLPRRGDPSGPDTVSISTGSMPAGTWSGKWRVASTGQYEIYRSIRAHYLVGATHPDLTRFHSAQDQPPQGPGRANGGSPLSYPLLKSRAARAIPANTSASQTQRSFRRRLPPGWIGGETPLVRKRWTCALR